jgi:SWIM/SEC-C metal-binding protein
MGFYPEEDRVTSRGTKQRPAVVRVRTEDRAQEILALCQEHGIQVIVGIEPDKTEDISDVERILWPPVPAATVAKVGRNDLCPCGSGKKYKKCCAGLASGA